jgi:hypothetical protein
VKEKKFHIISATTILAILLWGSVKLGNQFQTVRSVPVRPVNVPEGLALRSQVPRELQLTFRGEGWQLAAAFWGSDRGIPLDLHAETQSQRVITIRDVARALDLPSGVELVDMNPESVFVSLEPYGEKRLPVKLNVDVTCAEGYGLSAQPVLTPDSVTVTGAVSVLAMLEQVETARLKFQDLRSPLERDLGLSNTTPFMLTYDPPTVHALFNVQPFAEKALTGIPVIVRSVPHDREVLLVPPKIEVLVRGGIDRLATLTPRDIHAVVEFETIVADTSRTIRPQVTLPQGLTLVTQRPEVMQFVIRKRL